MNETTHQNLILDQFTRQAAPFSAAAMIKDEAVLRLIVEAASPRPDDTVLDVACGPGLVVCAFAPHVRLATGIDLTPAMRGCDRPARKPGPSPAARLTDPAGDGRHNVR